LLSSGLCSTQASSGSEPEAIFSLKPRKTAVVKPSVNATSSCLRVKDEAKLCSSTGAAWIRMAIAICMKDGPDRLGDDDLCTAIQDQDACNMELHERQTCNLTTMASALPDSQPPIHTEHELHTKNQAVAVTLPSTSAGDCDELTGNITSLSKGNGKAGSACEDLALGIENRISKQPQEGGTPGAPKLSKLGSSLKLNMMRRENDITLVSSLPISAVISRSFSDLYKASQAGGRINKVTEPMYSRESAELSSTSSLTASSKSGLLTERRNTRDPLEVSCNNACSVTCTTDYGADVNLKVQQCPSSPEKSIPGGN
jgi:hypothetical protein